MRVENEIFKKNEIRIKREDVSRFSKLNSVMKDENKIESIAYFCRR